MSSLDSWTVAVCYRAQHLSLALVRAGRVLKVRRHQIPGGYHARRHLRHLIRKFLTDYAVDRLVVEADRQLVGIVGGLHRETRALAIAGAKQCLLGPGYHDHRDLFRKLIDEHSELSRLVTVLPGTGHVAESERWKTVQLLSVALALAADQMLCHAAWHHR